MKINFGLIKENFVLVIIIIICLGVISLLVSIHPSLIKDHHTLKEFLHEAGLAIIVAGTVSVALEVWWSRQVEKRTEELGNNLRKQTIDSVLKKAEDWIRNGTSLPLDKKILDRVIKLGLDEWFQKEDFSSVRLSSSEISKVYHEERLAKLHGTAVKDQSVEFTYLGPFSSKNTQNNLIKIKLTTDFNIVNTARQDDLTQIRYINSKGILDHFILDLPDEISSFESKQIFDEIINPELIATQDEIGFKFELVYLPLDNLTVIKKIKNESIQDKRTRIETTGQKYDEKKAYIFHFLHPQIPNQIRKFEFLVFIAKPFKPQESMSIRYTRTGIFDNIDYFMLAARTLTQRIHIRLEKFDGFKTNIFARLVGDAKVTIDSEKIFEANEMIFADSIFLVNWKLNTEKHNH